MYYRYLARSSSKSSANTRQKIQICAPSLLERIGTHDSASLGTIGADGFPTCKQPFPFAPVQRVMSFSLPKAGGIRVGRRPGDSEGCIMAEGCPYGTCIAYGPGGITNLEKRHLDTGECRAAAKKRDKQPKKDGSISPS